MQSWQPVRLRPKGFSFAGSLPFVLAACAAFAGTGATERPQQGLSSRMIRLVRALWASPPPLLDPDRPLPDDLWRPANWRARFDPPRPRTHGWDAAVLALVVLSNVAANELLPSWTYIPANVLTGVVLVAIARHAGVSWDVMGLRVDRLGSGLRVGLIAAGVVGAGVILGVAVPLARSFFVDDRFVDVSTGTLVYETLLRIPIGTAFFEEVVFRGVLFGMLLRRYSVVTAATWSSVVFGLWHVLPALDLFETNPAGDFTESVPALIGAVAGGVVFTGLTGYAFTWLRLRGNSLLAPILAHTATNSLGYLAGYLVVSNGWA